MGKSLYIQPNIRSPWPTTSYTSSFGMQYPIFLVFNTLEFKPQCPKFIRRNSWSARAANYLKVILVMCIVIFWYFYFFLWEMPKLVVIRLSNIHSVWCSHHHPFPSALALYAFAACWISLFNSLFPSMMLYYSTQEMKCRKLFKLELNKSDTVFDESYWIHIAEFRWKVHASKHFKCGIALSFPHFYSYLYTYKHAKRYSEKNWRNSRHCLHQIW